MEKIGKGMIYEKKGVGQGPFKQTGRQQQQQHEVSAALVSSSYFLKIYPSLVCALNVSELCAIWLQFCLQYGCA